jgi:glycosyltransferase involved in cell wall biosynthesis
MRLLIDCSRLNIGGGIQVGLGFIHYALKDKSLKLCIVCSSNIFEQLNPCELISVECHVVGVNLHRGFFRQSQQIKSIERNFLPDIVFTVFGPSFWRSKCVNVQGFALPKMLYSDSRDSYSSNLTRLREQISDSLKKILLRRNVDYFVVETLVVKNRLVDLLKLDKKRVYVIGNSFSSAFESRCLELGTNRIEKGSAFKVFVPASFYHHKNLEIIPLVASVLSVLGHSDVGFIFTIDRNADGWMRLSSLAKRYNVEKMIDTVGSVPNKYIFDYYLSADAVICPSLVEASTAVFPEAFMSRRPLLVSDRDFSRQLCGSAALYFDPHNPQEIANIIVEVKNNQSLYNKLVKAGDDILKKSYPSPKEKWDLQLKMLREIAMSDKYKEMK